MTEEARNARNAYHREWARKNRDKVNEYQRRWKRKHPDKVKRYIDDYWERKVSEYI